MSDPYLQINDIEFVDLYLGNGYADIKGLSGTTESRVPAPAHLHDAIAALRTKCLDAFQAHEEPEFALTIGSTVFRITQVSDVDNENVFIVRRSSAQIRPFATLGFAPNFMRFILDQNLSGLVLVAGDMAVGKTSTAASLLVERLVIHGGVAMAIEDPPETLLNGIHGAGRCIQVPASRKSGGYKEHMTRAMRSGVNFMLIGEIRDDDTAAEVAKASINGNLIIATIHGGDIPQAIERLHAMCAGKVTNAYEILAQGLAAVIWQDLEKVPSHGSPDAASPSRSNATRLVLNTLIFDEPSTRTKVGKGEVSKLMQEVADQAKRNAWNPQLLNNRGNIK